MHLLWIFVFLVSLPAASWAQNAAIAFGTPSFAVSLPVEASAASLSVDQGSGAALFQGNVLDILVGNLEGGTGTMEGRVRTVIGGGN